MTAQHISAVHSAAGEWRTRRSGHSAHYYPADAVTSDGKPLCGLALFYLESVPLNGTGDPDGGLVICEDCRELVGLLAS